VAAAFFGSSGDGTLTGDLSSKQEIEVLRREIMIAYQL